MGVIDMFRYFSLSGDGASLGMAVTLAGRQHSGNDHRRMSLRKIVLSFGAIISATFLEIEETHPKDQHPIRIKIEKQTQEDRSSEGQRIAPRLKKTRQRSDTLLEPPPNHVHTL